MPGRDLDLARDAFERKDEALSRAAHTAKINESGHAPKQSSYRRCILYGGFEGLCTSCALLAALSAHPATPEQAVSVVFGVMLSMALALALRDLIRHRADHIHYHVERGREKWEMEMYPEGEAREMMELYEGMGISKADAELVIKTLVKYPKQFVDLMMLQELDMTHPKGSPYANALATFLSFLLVGMLPVGAYFGRLVDHGSGSRAGFSSPLTFGVSASIVLGGALAVTNPTIIPRQNNRGAYLLLVMSLCVSAWVAYAAASNYRGVLGGISTLMLMPTGA